MVVVVADTLVGEVVGATTSCELNNHHPATLFQHQTPLCTEGKQLLLIFVDDDRQAYEPAPCDDDDLRYQIPVTGGVIDRYQIPVS